MKNRFGNGNELFLFTPRMSERAAPILSSSSSSQTTPPDMNVRLDLEAATSLIEYRLPRGPCIEGRVIFEVKRRRNALMYVCRKFPTQTTFMVGRVRDRRTAYYKHGFSSWRRKMEEEEVLFYRLTASFEFIIFFSIHLRRHNGTFVRTSEYHTTNTDRFTS